MKEAWVGSTYESQGGVQVGKPPEASGFECIQSTKNLVIRLVQATVYFTKSTLF